MLQEAEKAGLRRTRASARQDGQSVLAERPGAPQPTRRPARGPGLTRQAAHPVPPVESAAIRRAEPAPGPGSGAAFAPPIAAPPYRASCRRQTDAPASCKASGPDAEPWYRYVRRPCPKTAVRQSDSGGTPDAARSTRHKRIAENGTFRRRAKSSMAVANTGWSSVKGASPRAATRWGGPCSVVWYV